MSGIDELRELLKGKDSIFMGHSGTGKSSIINAIEPGLNLKIGDISTQHYKGTHTTSSSKVIEWSFSGHLIDTPGIRTFTLKNSDTEKLPRYYPGFAKYAAKCAFSNCTHTHETNCVIKEQIDKKIPLKRYESYLKILES